MMLNNRIALLVISIILFSCAENNTFPLKSSERFTLANVVLNMELLQVKAFEVDSVQKADLPAGLKDLMLQVNQFELRNKAFNLEKVEMLWLQEKNRIDLTGLELYSAWIEITGFMLEVTGNAKYARELQSLIESDKLNLSPEEIKMLEQKLVPFIFTHDVDNIYINLYANATVQFEHSLKGKVKITTEIQDNGEVFVKFGMENKRMIELFLRIPDDAISPAVTEKKVKYVAIPGEYCRILRKWGEGDKVEIQF